jgi:hypothetical protein
MTNGEVRMTNQTAMANDEQEAVPRFLGAGAGNSSLPFRHSFDILTSSFVILA